MAYFLRLHKVQDNWGLSLRRCGGTGLELCCESGVSTAAVDEGERSDMV